MATLNENKGLESMSVKQLQQLCDRKKIPYTSKTLKPALIRLLDGTKAVAETGARKAGEY